jgi:hypothetical protein
MITTDKRCLVMDGNHICTAAALRKSKFKIGGDAPGR